MHGAVECLALLDPAKCDLSVVAGVAKLCFGGNRNRLAALGCEDQYEREMTAGREAHIDESRVEEREKNDREKDDHEKNDREGVDQKDALIDQRSILENEELDDE